MNTLAYASLCFLPDFGTGSAVKTNAAQDLWDITSDRGTREQLICQFGENSALQTVSGKLTGAGQVHWHTAMDWGSAWDTIVCQCRKDAALRRLKSERLVFGAPEGWSGEPLAGWLGRSMQVVKQLDGLGQNARMLLGTESQSRIEKFKKYEKGWDCGRGEPLNSESIALLDSFVNKFARFGHTPPSLFLTRNGNLQISWEDTDGNVIEVEFFPDRAEFYIGRTEEEGFVDIDPENPMDALERIIQKISK